MKIPRVTDEGWNSQKQQFDPVEKKKKKTLVSSYVQSSHYRPIYLVITLYEDAVDAVENRVFRLNS